MKLLTNILFFTFLICFGTNVFAMAEKSIKVSNTPTDLKILDQNETGLTIQLKIGEVHFNPVNTKGGAFVYPTVDGLIRSFQIGKPNLPIAGKIISIPIGAELLATVVDYKTEEYFLSDYGITNQIIPAQPSISKSDDPASIPFAIDSKLYIKSGFYSAPRVEIEILGIMRDIRLARVAISPIEYNPTENKIKVYSDITIKIDYLNADWAETELIRSKYYSPVFSSTYEQIFNYDSMESHTRSDSPDLTNNAIKYLIISDRMFETQLVEFIEWKTLKGFNVEVAFTDEIGYTTSAISTYIENVYNAGTPEDPAPSFVLLAGDAEQIPPFSGTVDSHVTDLYYCEFTGDYLPEIYYGRFSAQSTSQIQPQIDKTIEYEKYLMPDPSYLEEVTLVSGVDDTYAISHGNGQINYGTNYYFNTAHNIDSHVWLYPASAAGGVAGDILDVINDGVAFHNYTAHCNHYGQGDPSFTTSNVSGLTNYNKYFTGIGNCCLANTFAESSPCFGEALLQIEDKGAVGYIGATNNTLWYEDYYWGVGAGPVVGSGPTYEQTTMGAYDGVFHDRPNETSFDQHYVTNAAIVFAGNIGVTEGGSQIAYYWEIYHLMGDPSLMTYLGVPSTNSVLHNSTSPLNAQTFAVTADPGSYVAITVDGVLHGTSFVDETGSADVPLAGITSAATADIVITCQNRQPYFSTVQIISSDKFYVSATGEDLPGNGTEEFPYATIQYAVDNAGEYATIIVASGTYYGTTIIDKSLFLLGEDKESTIIDAEIATDLYAVEISGQDAIRGELSGFTIINSDLGAIRTFTNGLGTWHIHDNILKDNQGTGLNILDSCLVERNLIINNNTGIAVQGGASKIYNNSIAFNSNGLLISSSTEHADIQNNIIVNGNIGIQNDKSDGFIEDYNNVWNNVINYQDRAAGVHDISEDPLFIGGTPFDFNLQCGSQCINSGNPSFDNDPDGTIIDLGLYPYDYFVYPDNDGDDVSDICDNCPGLENHDQSDTDNDTVGDLCDNCIEYFNPSQIDTDGDEIGDACDWICGDVNDDTYIDILDIVYIINFKYKDGPGPEPPYSGDVNGDTNVDILDIVHLLNFIYKEGLDLTCP
ncbi:MAG: hypothetical protein GY855_02315 [candidate division Zixibacteria bacterium]|nr:hypothetical protein [candidate division Zixibacteria bacterium]